MAPRTKRRREGVNNDDIFAPTADTKRQKFEFAEQNKVTQERLLSRWEEFEQGLIQSMTDNEQKQYVAGLQAPPTIDLLERFFQFLARNFPGRGHDQLSVETLKRQWNELRKLVRIKTAHSYKETENASMFKYIESLATTEGARVEAEPKGLASFAVIEDLLYFLWACDEYAYRHPRSRVQLAFGMLLCGFSGVRPGELVESSFHRGSNEGLKYGDVQLVLSRANGLHIRVKRRLKKGKRNRADGISYKPFFQRPQNRVVCAVTHFIAIAIADGALDMDQITNARIAGGANSTTFEYRNGTKDLPIFRAIGRDQHSVSAGKILTYTVWNQMLVALGQRAGYEERLTSYCFRRGLGNALDKKVTAAERQAEMGHTNERSFQYYISTISGVDSQSLMMEQSQQTDAIDFVRSMNLHRNIHAPNPNSLAASGSRNPPNAKGREESIKLRSEKLKREREEYRNFFRNQVSTPSRTPSDSSEKEDVCYIIDKGIQRVRPKASRFLECLFRYEPDRAQAAQNFFPDAGKEGESDLSLADAVAPLARMADPKAWHASYPLARCIEDKCPWCDREYDSSSGRTRFNDHLLECYRNNWQQRKRQELEDFFFFRRPNSTEAGQSQGPSPISVGATAKIEPIKLSRCLWEGCYFDFVDKSVSAIAKHVTQHAHRTRGNRCRWLACTTATSNPRELSAHMLEAHRVHSEYTLPDKAHFCYQCAEWSESTHEWDRHCEGHLKDLKDRHCGRISCYSAVIFAGLCPFCIGGPGLPSERYHQFPYAGVRMQSHIKKHLSQMGRLTYTCPHPLCNDKITGEKEGYQHLEEAHGIKLHEKREAKSVKKMGGVPESEESSGDTMSPVEDF